MNPDEKKEKPVSSHEEITIHIDKKKYSAPKNTATGIELKRLAEIPDGFDIFKTLPGQEDDIKIGDSQQIDLKNGDHFYSVPKTLNPGTNNAVA
jgi:hypothetical protein